MPNCPNCQQPMRINRVDKTRSWCCPKMACTGTPGTSIRIPDDKSLSIADMAEDMALGEFFNHAAKQGKHQANFRRLAGGLNKLDHGQQYLSDSELQTLTGAARVLERLATAAEQAKKEKKRLDIEEKMRVEERHQQCMTLIADRFLPDDPLELALNVLTLGLIQRHCMPCIDIDDLRYHRQRLHDAMSAAYHNDLSTWINHWLSSKLNEQVRALADDIDDRQLPVEDLLETAYRAFEDNLERCRTTYQALLDEIDQALLIDKSDNVALLDTRSS